MEYGPEPVKLPVDRLGCEQDTQIIGTAVGNIALGRLSYVERLGYETPLWLPARAIIERLGTDKQVLYRLIRYFGIEPEENTYEGRVEQCYPPFTLPLLKDEIDWRKALSFLPGRLTITEIAENIGKSWGWTAGQLDILGTVPVSTDKRSSNESKLYSKSTLKQLRQLVMEFPMEEDWPNLSQLVTASGEDREWIYRRLYEAEVSSMPRRSAQTGKLLEYFPPHSLAIIERAKAKSPPIAEVGWLTAEAMPEKFGRSYNWCTLRLKSYWQLAALRRDQQGVSRLHYPPAVTEALKMEKAKLELSPAAGEYLTFSDIVIELGKSKLWVSNRLKLLANDGNELRRDKKGRLRRHYPRNVVDKILSLPEDLRHKN